MLAPRPTPKLENHLFSAVRDCLFDTFAVTLHIYRPFLHPQPEVADMKVLITYLITLCQELRVKSFSLELDAVLWQRIVEIFTV